MTRAREKTSSVWTPPEFIPFEYTLNQAMKEDMVPPELALMVPDMDDRSVTQLQKLWSADKLHRYKPNPFQDRVHLAKRRIVVARAGHRSGKSAGGAVEMGLHLTGNYPDWWIQRGYRTLTQPINAIIGIPEFGEHGRLMERRFRTMWPNIEDPAIWYRKKNQEGLYDYYRHLPTGSEVKILTYKQDTISWSGSGLHFVWLDEPPPLRHFQEAWRGLSDYKGTMLITMTPQREPWMFDLFDQGLMEARVREDGSYTDPDPLVSVVIGSSFENFAISDDSIRAMAASFTPEEVKTRVYGEYSFLQGLVFSRSFDIQRNVIKPFKVPRAWTRYQCIDPHQAKPAAIIYVAVAPWGQLFVYRELECRDPMPVSVAKACFAVERQDSPPRARYMDISANKPMFVKNDFGPDYSRRNFMEAYVEAFRDVFKAPVSFQGVTNAQDAIPSMQMAFCEDVYQSDPEHHMVKHGEKVPRLVIFDDCTNLIRQIQKYQYKEIKHGAGQGTYEEKALKLDDDFVDALLYLVGQGVSYVATRPGYRDPGPSRETDWMSS